MKLISSKISNLVHFLNSNLSEIVLPVICPLCQNRRIPINTYICVSCSAQLKPYSSIDGQFFNDEMIQIGITNPVFIGFYYNPAMQRLIHLLKYDGKQRFGYYLGRLLATQLTKKELHQFDYIIPVPIHKRKKRERGYNQVDAIAEGISDCLQIPSITDIVVRTRYTKAQAKLTRLERMENVSEAFAINPKSPTQLENKHILLVDDLITTGATILQLNKLLNKNGVSSVLNCAVATALF